MTKASSIEPDKELRDYLQGKVTVGLPGGGSRVVKVYRDWERPTNELPDDFIVVYLNGDAESLGRGVEFARGYIMVGLYCKMNEDGSIKHSRIKNILTQFDTIIDARSTTNFFFEYDTPRFITPTSPDQTTGYSQTVLNLKWTTNSNFSKES